MALARNFLNTSAATTREFPSFELQQIGSDSDKNTIIATMFESQIDTRMHVRSLQSDKPNTSLRSIVTTLGLPKLWVIAARGHIPVEYYVAFKGSRGLRAFPVRKWHCPAL